MNGEKSSISNMTAEGVMEMSDRNGGPSRSLRTHGESNDQKEQSFVSQSCYSFSVLFAYTSYEL